MEDAKPLDYTCLIHGKKMSEHEPPWVCLYCCLCYRPLAKDECHTLQDGTKEDVCEQCAEKEKRYGMEDTEPQPGLSRTHNRTDEP